MPLDKVYPAHAESSSYDTYIARYLTKIPDPPPIYLDRGGSAPLWATLGPARAKKTEKPTLFLTPLYVSDKSLNRS